MEQKIRAGVLTISTKGAAGLREDKSGDTVQRMLEDHGIAVVRRHMVPDRLQEIADTLMAWVDEERLPLIVTSGGTGLSPNDLTPQAMETVIDFQVPGMAEAMRAESLKKPPMP
jgi:molybdopterin adenylyltransferase